MYFSLMFIRCVYFIFQCEVKSNMSKPFICNSQARFSPLTVTLISLITIIPLLLACSIKFSSINHGYICPSTFPVASNFFFVAKKYEGLHPCVDYRALNKITIKNRYPLPLVPVALEHLCGASVFTKLDFRSAYNLIWIREGDCGRWHLSPLVATMSTSTRSVHFIR